jgi:PAS domain S-box-containing protein
MTIALTEQTLANDAELLRAVLNTVIDGLVTIDDRGVIHSFNPAASRILGYRPDEVIGQNVRMLMPEPYHGEHDGYLRGYLETGTAKVIGIGREVTARRKDGSIFPMELGVNEMRYGERRMFVGTIRDITDRKRKQDAEVFLRTVMSTILDGLITIDEAGSVLSLNPAAERLFGYSAEEVVGRNIKMLMPEPYHSEHDGYLRSFCAGGRPKVIGIAGRELVARRKDGTTFAMELGVNEMTIDGRRLFAGTVRDISARARIEGEIRESLAALARSNQELDEFAYIASHDLREPLRGVANNACFLKEDFAAALPPAAVKRLDRMTWLCQRMDRLVDDLLYFSRLGRHELAIQSTDLNEVIRDIETTLEPALRERNAAIVVARPLPTIRCDRPRITEMFRNLITNAIKYNDSADRRVEIGWSERPGARGGVERVFHVRDNGVGIAEEFHREVFRMFKRLNPEDDRVKGTGVGLTFVEKIVERHNGDIWIESAAGAGTTFHFTLDIGPGS